MREDCKKGGGGESRVGGLNGYSLAWLQDTFGKFWRMECPLVATNCADKLKV